MLEDKITEAYSVVIDAHRGIKQWKDYEKDAMKSVRVLIAAEKRFQPDFDGKAFLEKLDADADAKPTQIDEEPTTAEPVTDAE